MIPTLYRGSVKDVLGPIAGGAVVFEYTDAYSVFDWGRMPDALAQKGEALTILAADLFERLEKPETWKEFSRAPEALGLRKGNRFGAGFNELGEKLQQEGLRTHYLGVLPDADTGAPLRLEKLEKPARHLCVRQVSVVKPRMVPVLGRSIPDYALTRQSGFPRLVPLEVVFRFSLPPGSSLLERVAKDPTYLSTRGFPDLQVEPGNRWDFPILELFTKLESSDRPLTLTEGLAISGISADQLQGLLFKTAWVAGWLRALFARQGLELADGKLEWGVDRNGEIFLVDAIGPDELRILSGRVQLSKEFLRTFYRTTPWYEGMNHAKQSAAQQGNADWKKLVPNDPPALPQEFKEAASQLYPALTNRITGRDWFPGAWKLEEVTSRLEKLEAANG